MTETTKKVLIGLAATAIVGTAAYLTVKLSPSKEIPLADPLPGTDKIERLVTIAEKK